MFLMGNFEHSLDDKNRVRLPAKFREQLGDEYMLMPGAGGCIAVYPANESEKIISMLKDMETLDPDTQEQIRALVSEGASAEGDKQGRFIIPDNLLDIAGIEDGGAVRIVGAISKAEIWSEKRWSERRSKYIEAGVTFDDVYRKLELTRKEQK